MKLRFKTFKPWVDRTCTIHIIHNPTDDLNIWLEENSNIEIIDWKVIQAGDAYEYFIIVSYIERWDIEGKYNEYKNIGICEVINYE